jgi:hypothetical protein
VRRRDHDAVGEAGRAPSIVGENRVRNDRCRRVVGRIVVSNSLCRSGGIAAGVHPEQIRSGLERRKIGFKSKLIARHRLDYGQCQRPTVGLATPFTMAQVLLHPGSRFKPTENCQRFLPQLPAGCHPPRYFAGTLQHGYERPDSGPSSTIRARLTGRRTKRCTGRSSDAPLRSQLALVGRATSKGIAAVEDNVNRRTGRHARPHSSRG